MKKLKKSSGRAWFVIYVSWYGEKIPLQNLRDSASKCLQSPPANPSSPTPPPTPKIIPTSAYTTHSCPWPGVTPRAHCPKSNSNFRDITYKCSGQHNTTWNIPRSITSPPLHFMLYNGKSISFGAERGGHGAIKISESMASVEFLLNQQLVKLLSRRPWRRFFTRWTKLVEW